MFISEFEFPQAANLHYLNHAAVAPWPKRAADAVKTFAEENLQFGAQHYPAWTQVEQRLRQRLQRLINAPSSQDIALVKNTSEGLSFIAFGLDWRPGDQVVISDQEFPSNRVVWEALIPQGVEVIEVSLSGSDPETALLNACGPRTRLLAISSVQYASGLRLDMQQLGAGCKHRGVLFCIDAIQQLGALPFDVQAYDCDFAVADGHKWMMGAEGLGVFYCRSQLRDQLKLHEYGWHMLEKLGDYDHRDWQPANSARRFECGSPNMLGAMALEASLSLLEELGMPYIAQQLTERSQWLHKSLSQIPGCHLHSPQASERRAGIVSFSLQGQDNRTLHQQLMQAQVICAQRGEGVRWSPHFYTPYASLEQSIDILRRLNSHSLPKGR